MDNPQVLILNDGSIPCQTRDESKLLSLIGNIFPKAEIRYRNRGASLAIESFQPDIIFWRPPTIQKLPKLVNTLRERWLGAPIVGLFCQGLETPYPITSGLLTCLDDFLICPFQQLDVCLRIQRLLYCPKKVTEPDRSGTTFRVKGLVGESKDFLKTIEKIPILASSDATVLILGETGTGKELFARAIHYHGPRSGGPFIPVNCGALPEHLFENELFGHAKGAFTDAGAEQRGLLREAEGGTLFLDEVDALSPSAQIKLLRFLQDREYRPLGSSKSLRANVRILVATNRDVRRLVQEKLFRDDLYYRINALSLVLPPLRHRLEDIPALAKYFIARAERESGRVALQISSMALRKLAGHSWPGNARELETIIQRAATFCTSQTVDVEDIDLPGHEHSEVLMECSLRNAKRQAVDQFERTYLINLLTVHHGNVSQAAKSACKERRAFQRLLRKHDLNRTAFLGEH